MINDRARQSLRQLFCFSTFGLLVALLLAGCGSSTFTGTKTAPAVTVSASPTSISAGGSSTLTVVATNATTVTIAGSDGSSYNLAATGGTQAVSPKATTTYTATAAGTAGNATATATVTVSAGAGLLSVSLSANPTTISAGGTSTLTAAATNASKVVITGSDGSSYTLGATGGTQSVTPAATTTYTATATGSAGGTATATATVTVSTGPIPTVTLSANPTAIASGGTSTLTASATNSSKVVVTGSDGSSYTLGGTGGTQAVTPAATTTYTATATGTSGGTATATATVTISAAPPATVTITADPSTIVAGNSSTLTVVAANATDVTIAGSDGSSYTLAATGGNQAVKPAATTTYTATATGAGGNATATAIVTVNPQGSVAQIDHVIFLLQENHSFDNYFGMLNPYRATNHMNVGDDGVTYNVDGIDDKLTKFSLPDDQGTSYPLFKFTTTCVDDMSSDWLSSYGDVNRYDFLTTRAIQENGFVHTAEGYANSCVANGSTCSGSFTDLTGERSMGYYDEGFLNYYYYMASQFAVSDRWFSPVASKSIDNRIATFSGGTTQGLVKDPGGNDHLTQLALPSIFQELDTANVSWKIYYSTTAGFCGTDDDCSAGSGASAYYPATDFENFQYSYRYIYENPTGAACVAPTQASGTAVGDPTNSFCIDTAHIAPLTTYFTDLTNGTLPSFAFIEANYAAGDEHPGSGQQILAGQYQVAHIMNSFMSSSAWPDSVFFFAYDEGGGPFDHVPPVPGHSNDNTDTSLGTIPDITSIAVNPDTYFPCVPPTPGTPTTHCDLETTDPGANPGDAAAVNGFAAQLGFRLPNMILSPFTRKHYVSHTPMDHTAVIKFVESRFINPTISLTKRDAAQPNLLEFFDFNNIPWATPPTPPVPYTDNKASCTPSSMGP